MISVLVGVSCLILIVARFVNDHWIFTKDERGIPLNKLLILY